MTAEAQVSKNYYRLNGGLNTENNEIGFPEGYTTDEANYELLVDGSRRRRKGLAEESGGSTKVINSFSGDFHQTFLWRNVGGDPTFDVIVYREGKYLYFATAGETLSDGWSTDYIAMSDFFTSGTTTANTDDAAISFAHGRGRLLVSGQYIRPFYVDYDGTNFNASLIDLKFRDFSTIDEGIPNDDEPAGGATAITADHLYNLRNRGWTADRITVFDTDLSKYPALNALWFKGFKRVFDGSTASAQIADFDGARVWDSAKMDAEVFGSSSAPKGALLLSPFDTTVGYATSGSVLFDITSVAVNTSTWVATITTASAHGMGVGDTFLWQNNSFNYQAYSSPPTILSSSFDGKYVTETGTTGSTIVVTVDEPLAYFFTSSWGEGQIDTAPLTRSTGTAHTDSFRAVAWHAGRAFYGGMANTEFADSVFYSQVVDTADKYGKCYQEADPTDEYFNAIVPTDGGELVVPGLNGIVEMISTRSSLLVLGRDGVWEINGGRDGFTADTFNLRKLTDEGCSSSTSVVKIEGAVIYTGPGGIYIIAPNQYTGILEVQNAIQGTIQTKWNSITTTEQERCQAVYDDAQKRAYFLVKTSHADSNATGSSYDEVLVFDSKIAAWYRYTFSADGLLTLCAIPTADDPASNKKMKFIYEVTSTTVKVADFAQTTFDDWDGNNGPVPYMYTGWDQSAPYQSRRQAPLVTVHSKRTETGYVDNGTGWDPTNTSSTLMSAYWDWTDDAVTNKIGASQEVYRHTRDFAPAAADDVSGYPVITTRNKVRGRGRALQLKFQGATDKDSHILGYTVNYKVSRRK